MNGRRRAKHERMWNRLFDEAKARDSIREQAKTLVKITDKMGKKCNNFETNRTDGYQISQVRAKLDKEIGNFEQVKVQSEKYNAAQKLSCKRAAVTLPNGERVNGVWKIVSAFDILPSHNPKSYADSKNFPLNREGKNVNDRNYATDRLAQNYVAAIAQKFDGRALEEPIRISKDGIVVDGNNRTMSRVLAHENGTDMAYLEALYEFATEKCLCHDDIDQITAPTMVFEIDSEPTYSRAYFAAFNKNTKKEKTAVDTTITLASTVSPRVRNIINQEFDRYENLSELYASSASVRTIRNALVDGGVILDNELNKYFEQRTASFTDEGKKILQRLVLSGVLTEDNIRVLDTEGLKNFAEKLLYAIVPIADNQRLPTEYALKTELNAAIDILHTAARSSMSVADLISQGSMFSETQIKADYGTLAVAISLSKSKTQFKKIVNIYNTAANAANGGSMFVESEKRDKQQILKDMVDWMDSQKILTDADRHALKRYERMNEPTVTMPSKPKSVIEQLPSNRRKLSKAEEAFLTKQVKKETEKANNTPSVPEPVTRQTIERRIRGIERNLPLLENEEKAVAERRLRGLKRSLLIF